MADSEIGVWRLVEARARDAQGNTVPSQFGPTPLGVVTFDGRRMIAALGDAREAVPEDEGPRQYNSYAGPYRFDGTTLVTGVDCASSADRMGTDQVRGVRFDTLVRICAALDCQPGDLLEYRPGPEDEIEP